MTERPIRVLLIEDNPGEARLAEIERSRTSAFDPDVVDAFLRVVSEKGWSLLA